MKTTYEYMQLSLVNQAIVIYVTTMISTCIPGPMHGALLSMYKHVADCPHNLNNT